MNSCYLENCLDDDMKELKNIANETLNNCDLSTYIQDHAHYNPLKIVKLDLEELEKITNGLGVLLMN